MIKSNCSSEVQAKIKEQRVKNKSLLRIFTGFIYPNKLQKMKKSLLSALALY